MRGGEGVGAGGWLGGGLGGAGTRTRKIRAWESIAVFKFCPSVSRSPGLDCKGTAGR